MNLPSSAERNLSVIRALMERSAVYRRALGPILVTVGGLGMAAAVAGVLLNIEPPRVFNAYWLAVAAVALVAAFSLSRRQARREQEPFWSPPTRQVAIALAPPLLIGAGFSLLSEVPTGSVIIWLLAYGMALHAAGFGAPPGLRRLGWLLLAVGVAVALWSDIALVQHRSARVLDHLVMGISFGLLHLVCGLHILVTERRAPTP